MFNFFSTRHFVKKMTLKLVHFCVRRFFYNISLKILFLRRFVFYRLPYDYMYPEFNYITPHASMSLISATVWIDLFRRFFYGSVKQRL